MRVAMIGGTGLLGAAAAAELIRRGHDVVTLARSAAPEGATLPAALAVVPGDYLTLSDADVRALLEGTDAFVFAAGADERMEGPAPIYDLFAAHNNAPLERWLTLARETGVRRAVVCGSYFVHADRIWPELGLARRHPYIRSRVDQEAMALDLASEDFAVAVLELPYIFGAQPGRKPVWVFLVEAVLGMKGATFFPKGGTTAMTVRQVGQAIAGACESALGDRAYPLGWDQLTWRDLLTHVHAALGTPRKPIVTVPTWAFALAARAIRRRQLRAGHEGGLDLRYFPALQTRELFIDPALGSLPLGVTADDIGAAIADSVRASLPYLPRS